jgi:hypothetical protein
MLACRQIDDDNEIPQIVRNGFYRRMRYGS